MKKYVGKSLAAADLPGPDIDRALFEGGLGEARRSIIAQERDMRDRAILRVSHTINRMELSKKRADFFALRRFRTMSLGAVAVCGVVAAAFLATYPLHSGSGISDPSEPVVLNVSLDTPSKYFVFGAHERWDEENSAPSFESLKEALMVTDKAGTIVVAGGVIRESIAIAKPITLRAAGKRAEVSKS